MKGIFLASLLLLCAFSGAAQAVDCSRVQSRDKAYSVCRVDFRRDKLRLFLKDEAGQHFRGFEALSRSLSSRGELLVFAMNAGMYHADFSPVGLFVAGGVALTPLNTSVGTGNFFLKPNGVFQVSPQGFGVTESGRYATLKSPAELATQSGPMLLSRGVVHPAFRPGSTSRLLRNGVGIVSPEVAVFAISDEPVNFYEFALLFRDTLGCRDALYFDGNISSLHSIQLGRSDALHPLGPIVGITQQVVGTQP
jgi:uncharacterized protein YigE (DUF2233 family)